MFQSVECRGYKAFSQQTRLDLRPITVIFGKNNSGKTTLARLPIFVASSIASENLYSLSALGIQFGSSFSDLASVEQAHPAISIGAKWAMGREITVELQRVVTRESIHTVQPISITIDQSSARFPLRSEPLAVSDWLAEGFDTDITRIQHRRDELASWVGKCLHLAGARPKIENTYAMRESVDLSASEVPYLLANDAYLLDATSSWFSKNLDGMGVFLERAAFAFRLNDKAGVGLSVSGRGTQSVLPVVALLTAVASGYPGTETVIVEEPEEHLHPSVHGALADLIIQVASRATILVETHSENFILRLRRRLAAKQLDPSQLALYYVDDEHVVTEIELDEYGSALNWPTGVFESDIEEAQAIVESRLQAIGTMGEPEC